jgi:small basic protein (TIGR04137 family)
MSIDRSLKSASNLSRHCNVLSRAERIAKLAVRGKFDLTSGDPLGLPKVANRKVATGGKTAKKAAAAEAGAAAPTAAGAAPAAAPTSAKAAPGAAAPAKAAAPAAKGAAKKA